MKKKQKLGKLIVNIALFIICALWTIPTLGLLVSSIRSRDDILSSGWWKFLPHRQWVTDREISLPKETSLNEPITIEGYTTNDDTLQLGYEAANDVRYQWINRRERTIAVQSREWVFFPKLTFDNYSNVLTGKEYTYNNPDGTTKTEKGTDMSSAFLNSVAVAIPATVIPILIAAFAAYGFAWMKFPGRKALFVVVVALLVVPLQLALIPVLKDYVNLKLNGTYLAVWLAHTGFGLPLAIYLLFNYISTIPRDIFESAFIDGASHFTIFTRLVLPLSVPALASFAIFQFMWVWNDYLVALVFIGSKPDVQVMTMRLAEMVGSRGQDWHILTAGAFVSMLLPLAVFFALQRYFVRGLMAGSVKG
ncbi:MAG: carbohydrate ABC transporter permease [Anaerolineaceae bacterium]|jgi:alpha-glucoside transport system permease protein|nr:carbohydrate ABC transporter permease [Anaerolineaceae bacterium]